MTTIAAALFAALLLAPQAGATHAPTARPAAKPTRTDAAKGATSTQTAAEIVQLRQAVASLTAEVALLRKDIAQREANGAGSLNAIRLLLVDERVARLGREVNEAKARVRTAQARVEETQYRMDHIEDELIMNGGLNREDAERTVRASLTRQMQEYQREVADAEADERSLEADLADARHEAANLSRHTEAVPHAARPAEHGQEDQQPSDTTSFPQPVPGDEQPPDR